MKNEMSANSLFHFTNSYDTLISILKNNFYPRYSLEDLSNIKNDDKQTSYEKVAFPMVCFCDIPLSRISQHTRVYGKYGIGLTKEWGIKNGLNPIFYVVNDSVASLNYKKITQFSTDIIRDKSLKNEPTNRELTKSINNFSRYMKAYNGNNKKGEYVEYYNEREWRYITDVNLLLEHGLDTALYYSKFDDEKKYNRKIHEINDRIVDIDCLEFCPDDIKYIIINSEEEILRITRELQQIKGKKYSYNAVTLLTTKILTHKQVVEDF